MRYNTMMNNKRGFLPALGVVPLIVIGAVLLIALLFGGTLFLWMLQQSILQVVSVLIFVLIGASWLGYGPSLRQDVLIALVVIASIMALSPVFVDTLAFSII